MSTMTRAGERTTNGDAVAYLPHTVHTADLNETHSELVKTLVQDTVELRVVEARLREVAAETNRITLVQVKTASHGGGRGIRRRHHPIAEYAADRA